MFAFKTTGKCLLALHDYVCLPMFPIVADGELISWEVRLQCRWTRDQGLGTCRRYRSSGQGCQCRCLKTTKCCKGLEVCRVRQDSRSEVSFIQQGENYPQKLYTSVECMCDQLWSEPAALAKQLGSLKPYGPKNHRLGRLHHRGLSLSLRPATTFCGRS